MENPIYKLEGILRQSATEELQDFEGPLDLILFLLHKNKIEIQDLSITLILEQYLLWMERRQQMDLEVTSEFITMAAHLMYLKTKMLLSIEEAESEVQELIHSLEERQQQETYLRIKAVLGELGERSSFGGNSFVREAERLEQGTVLQYSHRKEDLSRTMDRLLQRNTAESAPTQSVLEEIVRQEPYSVREKTAELLQWLRLRGQMTFAKLFAGSRSRSEIVATFLAVLELCRTKKIQIQGWDTDSVMITEKEEG